MAKCIEYNDTDTYTKWYWAYLVSWTAPSPLAVAAAILIFILLPITIFLLHFFFVISKRCQYFSCFFSVHVLIFHSCKPNSLKIGHTSHSNWSGKRPECLGLFLIFSFFWQSVKLKFVANHNCSSILSHDRQFYKPWFRIFFTLNSTEFQVQGISNETHERCIKYQLNTFLKWKLKPKRIDAEIEYQTVERIFKLFTHSYFILIGWTYYWMHKLDRKSSNWISVISRLFEMRFEVDISIKQIGQFY